MKESGICSVTLYRQVYVAAQHEANYRVIPPYGKTFLLRCSKLEADYYIDAGPSPVIRAS